MIDAVARAILGVGLGPQKQAVDGTPAGRIEGLEALQQEGEGDHIEDEHLTESEKRMKEEEMTFYSSTHNDHGDDNIWGLLSGVGGNVYEWYAMELTILQGKIYNFSNQCRLIYF